MYNALKNKYKSSLNTVLLVINQQRHAAALQAILRLNTKSSPAIMTLQCVFLMILFSVWRWFFGRNMSLLIKLITCKIMYVLYLCIHVYLFYLKQNGGGVPCIKLEKYNVFVCGNKMPTRCNRGFYYRSYCLLNMFRAPLCPSAEGYVSGLQDAAASCKPDT